MIISLCDLTGNIARPWVAAGHTAILVDPQHEETRWEGAVLYVAATVEEALPTIGEVLRSGRRCDFVAAFPPCTDLAVSGARWFADKRKKDPMFQASAVAEQCRVVGELSGAPYFVENPVSVLSSVWGTPDHIFHPWEYAGFNHDLEDHYTKKTCLWAGGGFKMPEPCPLDTERPPDDRIHKAAPGPDRANFRSATPLGFSRAVAEANGA